VIKGYNKAGGGIMRKILIMVNILLTLSVPLAQASGFEKYPQFEKYPGNANKHFPTVYIFYQKIIRQEYTEYPNAVYTLREKSLFKNVNSIFTHVPKKFRVLDFGGSGFSPERQVYIFVSVG
jgi:hypothetical protein